MKLSFYFTLILIAATLIMLFISYISWTRRKIPGALSCSLGILAAAFYAFGYAFEISSSTLEQIKFWLKIEYIGIPFICALWIILAIQYTGFGSYLCKKLYIAIFIIPVLTFISHYTNDFHKLFYKDMYINSSELINVVILIKGPIYWLHIAYSYLLLVIGIILYLNMLFKSVEVVRRQIVLMVLGAIAPWVLNMIYLSRSFGYNIDLEPLGFAFSGIFYCLGIFKFKLLRLTPIALTKVFESLKDGVIILDSENNVVNFNNKAGIIISKLMNMEEGKNNINYILQEYPALLEAIRNYDGYDGEMCITSNGSCQYYRFSTAIIYDGKLEIGKLLVLSDITEYKQLVDRLNELACTDELTKLYNRRYFNERCENEINNAKIHNQALSIIIVDIDYFKIINDTYGHHVGDEILKRIADVCRGSLRESDVIARYGGEEFAILLSNTKCHQAIEVAEKLRVKILNSKFVVEGSLINITSSFGVYGLNVVTNEKLSDIIIMADRALYKAKEEGRNRVISYNNRGQA